MLHGVSDPVGKHNFGLRKTSQSSSCHRYLPGPARVAAVIDSNHQNIERKGAKDPVMTKYAKVVPSKVSFLKIMYVEIVPGRHDC